MILAIVLIIAALTGCIWVGEGYDWLGGVVLLGCVVIALLAY